MRAAEVECLLADLADGQWGLVTAPQARAAGITYVRLTRMTQAGMLRRVAHGVYRLKGLPPDDHRDLRAAWLALEPAQRASARLSDGPGGAVVSHFSAAAMHGLGPVRGTRHEFIVPGRKQSRRGDVRLHRGSLNLDDITVAAGLPVTTIERLIVDLIADGADLDRVAEVYARAARHAAFNEEDLADRLEPYAMRRGFAERDGSALMHRLASAGPQLEIVVG